MLKNLAALEHISTRPDASLSEAKFYAKKVMNPQFVHSRHHDILSNRLKSEGLIPFISIIVLNWNGLSDSLECLRSLEAVDYPRFDVIFADNGSSDGSVAAVRKEFPNVVILENGSNLGYAEGNNRAMRLALQNGADAVLILNNDTIVEPDLLTAFVEAQAQLPDDVGMLGAVSYFYDDRDIIAAAGAKWDPVALRDRHICKRQTASALPSPAPFEVDYVIGCALFVSRDVLDKVGLLASEFFLNGEDVDWGLRARKAGLHNYTVPRARIFHKVAASFGGGSPIWRYFMTRNNLLWTSRHLTPSQHRKVLLRTMGEILPAMDFLEFSGSIGLRARAWRLATWWRRVCSPVGRAEFVARLYGVLHFLRRRFGDCPPSLRKRLTTWQPRIDSADSKAIDRPNR